MSLTGLINNNKDVKEFFKGIKPEKNKFYTLSGKSPFSKEYIEKFTYNLEIPYNSTLIGTAFDYLARFEIARNIDNNKQGAYEELYDGIPADGLECISFALDYNLIMENLKGNLSNSLNVIEKYVNLDVDDFDILFEKSLFLARLEHFYRGGRFGAISTFKNMGMCPENIILMSDDFKYKEIVGDNKELSKSTIVSKDFIKVNGEVCKVSFSYDDIVKVEINIECYDEYKNLLGRKEIDLNSFSKEFNIFYNTHFIKVIISCNESKIDINKYIRLSIWNISNEKIEKILSYFTRFNDNVINELKNLFVVFKDGFVKDIIKRDSIVIFNPTFGLGSELVGGADADIYIDGVLYDFKTTRNRGYVGKDIYQIIGYYLLNEITKSHKKYYDNRYLKNAPLIKYEINKIAFYKVRFGEVEYLDVSFLDEFNLKDIIKNFEKILKKVNGNFEEIVKKHESML